MARFLLAPWATGGAIPPQAGLAAALLRQGHEVHVVSTPAAATRFEALGCKFVAYEDADEGHDWQRDVWEDNVAAWAVFATGTGLARDILASVDVLRPDALLVDWMLFSALAAAERSGLPYAALAHGACQPAVEGYFRDVSEPLRPLMASTRADLGLPPPDEAKPFVIEDLRRADLVLAMLAESFDVALSEPYPNLRYVGPIFEPLTYAWEPPAGGRELVLVSLSTTNMRQGPLLQRILDAVGRLDVAAVFTLGDVAVGPLAVPANAMVVDWIPHAAVLPHASLVVSHGGMSTLMATLAAGLPLVCVPLGRDQPRNGQRLAELGAGLTLPEDASVAEIEAAISAVLRSPAMRAAASTLAEDIASYGNGEAAVNELETLLSGRSRASHRRSS